MGPQLVSLVALMVFVKGIFILILFLLVMEVLSRLLKKTEEGDFVRGFQASPNARRFAYFSSFFLLMILFFFVMHPENNYYIFGWCRFSLKLLQA